jgi:hypothetical protein
MPIRAVAGSRVGGTPVACDARSAPLTRRSRLGQSGNEEDGYVLPGLRAVRAVVISTPLLVWPGVRRRAAKAEPALTPGPAPRSGAA